MWPTKLRGSYKDYEVKLLSIALNDLRRGNGPRFKLGTFSLDARKKILTGTLLHHYKKYLKHPWNYSPGTLLHKSTTAPIQCL